MTNDIKIGPYTIRKNCGAGRGWRVLLNGEMVSFGARGACVKWAKERAPKAPKVSRVAKGG